MSLKRIVGLSFSFTAIFVTILSVAGCVNPARPNDTESIYPKSFPKLIRLADASDCAKVTGWYRNKGVRIDSDGTEHEAVLTHDVLNLGDLFDANDEINISIDKKEEKLVFLTVPAQRLQIVSRSGTSWQGDWDKGICEKGYLLILQNRPVEGSSGYMVISPDNTQLAPAVDGSLIVKRFAATAGIIFIVPFSYISLEAYFNFPSANHEGSANR
ncbi:MAG: hypothetical protein IH606_12125 [Burkholderiales bacterium]|nr:hypothetical protein [Burkholderiales bacterium]